MNQRESDDPVQRGIPSFLETGPPLINNPFMKPRPDKATNLLEKFDESSGLEDVEAELVQVYLRLKPCKFTSNIYEVQSDQCLVTSLDTATAGHGRRTQHNVAKMYTFTRIFKPECNQKEIFEQVVKENLKKLVEGHSFTLLTYGASGSGKTYTVMGTVKSPGLVPRSLEYLFKLVDAAQTPTFKPSENGTDQLRYNQQEFELQWVKRFQQVSCPIQDKYRRMSVQLHKDLTISNVNLNNRTKHYVWVSFVEIYNENIYDLLSPPEKRLKLRIREDSSGNVYVKGVTQAFVRSGEEAYNVMVAGKQNLVVAATGIHAQSSRSHCIFTITMLTENDGEIRSSQVRLCDLAGSERQNAARNTGARMKESRAINSSLHVLERCLHMLRKKQRLTASSCMVPYRESKLTRLLGSGLSGERGEAISMVVTLNTAPQHAHEAKHVLSLASVAKDIHVNNTMAMTLSSLERTSQDSTYYSDDIIRLRADNERLHFELIQAQSCIEDLRAHDDKKRQENADIMSEMVAQTKEFTKHFYMKRLAAKDSQINDLKIEMAEMVSEYQSKLADAEERISWLEKQLEKKKTYFIEEGENRHGEKDIINTTNNYIERTEVSSDSETENDSDAFEESLEPSHKQNIKGLDKSRISYILQKNPPEPDVIKLDGSSEENFTNDSHDESDTNEVNDINSKTRNISYLTDHETDDDNEVNGGELKEAKNKDYESVNVNSNKDLKINYVNYSDHEIDDPELRVDDFNDSEHESDCKILKSHESTLDGDGPPSKDSLYATGDEDSEINNHGEKMNTLNITGNLSLTDFNKNDRENIASVDVEEIALDYETEKSDSEAMFNISTKQDETQDDVVLSNVRETYFSSEENKNKELITINPMRGTYFISDRDESFYKQVNISEESVKNSMPSKVDENSPTKNKPISTEFAEPKNVSKKFVSRLLKTRLSSFSSLKQFEQLESAVNEKSVDTRKDFNLSSANLPTLNKKKNYFDDSMRVEVSNATDDTSTADDKTHKNVVAKISEKKISNLAGSNDIYVLSSSNISLTFDASKKQEKEFKEDCGNATKSANNQDKTNTITINKVTPDLKKSKYFDESDRVVPINELISKSPTSVDDLIQKFEPSVSVKKVLGKDLAKPDILSSRKDLTLKKHASVDVFESPQVNISTFEEEILSNFNMAKMTADKSSSTTETISFANVKESTAKTASLFSGSILGDQHLKQTTNIKQEQTTLERTSVHGESMDFNRHFKNKSIIDEGNFSIDNNIKINIEQSEQTQHLNNTIEEYENIVKDLTSLRTTEFESLVSSDNIVDSKTKPSEPLLKNSNDKEKTHTSDEKENIEASEQTKIFENVKYNLRNKNKSRPDSAGYNKNEELEKITEQEKAKPDIRRRLRLRRRLNQKDTDLVGEDNKLKDIINLEKEFSDVTLGLPAVKKVVNDIPSPEKLPGEEGNVPPIMGIRSCPSKSVTRSRRKLFTPCAEPLEESPPLAADSNERIRIPRPSYHRVRARRKL